MVDDHSTECGIIWTDNKKITDDHIEKVYKQMKESEEGKDEPDLTIDNLVDWLSAEYKDSKFDRVFTDNVSVDELY